MGPSRESGWLRPVARKAPFFRHVIETRDNGLSGFRRPYRDMAGQEHERSARNHPGIDRRGRIGSIIGRFQHPPVPVAIGRADIHSDPLETEPAVDRMAERRNTQPAARRRFGLPELSHALENRKEPLVALPHVLPHELVAACAGSGKNLLELVVGAPGVS